MYKEATGVWCASPCLRLAYPHSDHSYDLIPNDYILSFGRSKPDSLLRIDSVHRRAGL